MPGNELLSVLGMLACAAGVIGLAYWFTRRLGRTGGPGGPGAARGDEGLRVLARVAVGREQSLMVAAAGGRYFLLGVTPAGICKLAELTAEEAAVWRREGEAARSPTFREAFLDQLGRKR